MTKKVVQFKPASTARVQGSASSARSRRDADDWVAAAQPETAAPAVSATAHPPVGAAPPERSPSELAESLGQLSREMSALARAPLERHLGAAARLASCRTPAEALAAQSALARDMMTGAIGDFARLAEASARAGRAFAATIERDPQS